MKALCPLLGLLAFLPRLAASSIDTCDESSLRAAMAGGGNVTINCDGVITLYESLVVSNDVSLSAVGHAVTISGAAITQVFRVQPGSRLKLTHLTVADGLGDSGGGILNDGGTVELTDCVLQNNAVQVTAIPMPLAPSPACGGAIYNRAGSLVLNGTLIVSNAATGWTGSTGSPPVVFSYPANGAGVYNEGGSVSATNSSFVCNVVRGPLTTLWPYPGLPAYGGAIYSAAGTVTLDHATFSKNTAQGADGFPIPGTSLSGGPGGAAGGGAIAAQEATLTIVASQFFGNSVTGGKGERTAAGGTAGGGALWLAEGLATIQDSSFTANRAIPGAGQRDSGPGAFGMGGAIFNGGTVRIERTVFTTNSTAGASASPRPAAKSAGLGWGGAIHNSGNLSVDQGSFYDNSTMGGAAVFADKTPGQGAGGAISSTNGAELILTRSTFSGNVAEGGPSKVGLAPGSPGGEGDGGAVFSLGRLFATNLTVTANRAVGGAGDSISGGVPTAGGRAVGGGIFSGGLAQVHYATFAMNEALGGQGGVTTNNGIGIGGNLGATSVVVTVKNSLLVASPGAPQCAGVSDAGYNLCSDNNCPSTAPGSRTNVALVLGPLTDNGGPVTTMALAAGGPGVDAADATDCPVTDARGETRPFNRICDIGAYESHDAFLRIRSGTPVGNEIILGGVGTASIPFRVQESTDLADWQVVGTGQVTAFGTFTVRVPARSPTAGFLRLASP